jgi:hypothetical protein
MIKSPTLHLLTIDVPPLFTLALDCSQLAHLDLLLINRLNGQWTSLDHDGHDLIQRIRSRHRSQLSIRIIRGSDLNEIRRDNVDALEPSEDRAQLAGRPAAGLGRAGGGSECGIQSVDVDGEVDGVLGADAFLDLLDDALGADGVDLASFDAREADVAVVFVVTQPGECCADAGVNIAVVGEQAFLGSPVEVGAVVDGGLLGRRATEDLGLPGVEVGVEMDDADGAVGAVDTAEKWESDCVVTAQGDEARQGAARLGHTGLGGGREGLASEESVVALFNLLQRVGVVVGGDWDVAAVNHLAPEVEGVGVHGPAAC